MFEKEGTGARFLLEIGLNTGFVDLRVSGKGFQVV